MQLLVIGGKEDVKKLSKDQELKLLAQLFGKRVADGNADFV